MMLEEFSFYLKIVVHDISVEEARFVNVSISWLRNCIVLQKEYYLYVGHGNKCIIL